MRMGSWILREKQKMEKESESPVKVKKERGGGGGEAGSAAGARQLISPRSHRGNPAPLLPTVPLFSSSKHAHSTPNSPSPFEHATMILVTEG